MKKKLTLAGIILSVVVHSQNSNQDYTQNTNDAGRNIPKISPTTPESFKFSQYGNIPIGLFTGAPNINIPITNLTVDDVSIPIALNYTSNGINVDEMNGSVGLGWTFLSGGVITRTIRDKPDEQSSYNSGDVPLLENSASQMTEYLKFCEVDDFDSEPDLYTANFGGNNVKFLINKSGNIIMLDQRDYKIKRNDNGNLFSIILENGVKYNFNEVENIRNRTLNTGGHQPSIQYPQSWYLTSIVTTKGNTINFEYQNINYTNIISQSQSMSYTIGTQGKYGDPTDSPNGGFNNTYCPMTDFIIPANNIGLVADSQQVVSGKQISKIYDSYNNSIAFTYSAQTADYSKLINVKKYHNNEIIDDISFNYLTTSSARLFLSEIKYNKSNSSHKFSYFNPDSFPVRLSFGRDMWGYYNGKNNNTLVPQISGNSSIPQYNGADQSVNPAVGYYGLLKNVIYPTGGNTQLNYENHVKKDYIQIPATQTSIGISTSTQANGSSTSTKEVTIIPKKSGNIRIGISNYLNESGNCYNSPELGTGKQRANIEVKNSAGQSLQLLEYSSTQNSYVPVGNSYTISVNNNKELYVYGEKDQPLKILATARWFCSNVSSTATYYDSEGDNILADVILGGYRISSIVDTPNNGAPITRKYKYIKNNGDYSIHQTRDPLFKENRIIASTCPGVIAQAQPIYLNYTVITSSNINKLFSFNPNIFYETVSEEIEGKGKSIHYFSVNSDEPSTIVRGSEILTSNWTNSGWKNGREILTVYKDNNNISLRIIENNYIEDSSRTIYLGAINRRKFFEPTLSNDTWNNFENLDVAYYKNISRFSYLNSQKITDYLEGVPVLSQTEYFYNNPSHYQLSKQKITLPDGKSNETTYSYAHEKNNPLMIAKNMIGIPLETKSTQTIGTTTKTLSRAETIYPISQSEANTRSSGLVLPLTVKSYNLQNTEATEVTYNRYDDKGNILQYTTKSGIPVAIVWGYKQTQPIAKIEGATYAEVQSLAAAIITASNTDASAVPNNDETALLNALKTFRNGFPNYQVTTYTYDPLIGVRSITPPSGVREVYLYDTANRLKEIREQNQTGKLLKEFKYNYKN